MAGIANPCSTVKVLNVGALAKDAHTGARVERPHVRTKTYIKDWHAAAGTHSRRWPFLGMPVLAAATKLDVPLRMCNEACIINFAGCNMKCWFCFAGELLDAKEQAVDEVSIVELWDEVMEQWVEDTRHEKEWRVLRVTGGEPMLQQEELRAFVQWRRHVENGDGPPFYLWLDTNLGVLPTGELQAALIEVGEPTGIVCCFKGFTDGDVVENSGTDGDISLDDQFAIAYEWWTSGLDVYFYVVDCTRHTAEHPYGLAESFINQMQRALGRNAPLKTSVIDIRETYKCQSREKPDGLVCNTIGPYWEHALYSSYTAEELATPPHLVARGE